MAGNKGIARLTETLTGSKRESLASSRIWFKVLPIPPRSKQGSPHIDLAVGTIAVRQGTDSGIELDDVESPWVCFGEMKWYSDISVSVAYDVERNHLARVMENAVCFQKSGTYAERVYVTRVTPIVFRDAVRRLRLYQYKFREYCANRQCIIDDLEASVLAENPESDWFFPPDLRQRAHSLSPHWATYDELFENLPH